MKWGVFEKRAAVHVCPCEDGYATDAHSLSASCSCHPTTEWDENWKRPLVVHHAIPFRDYGTGEAT